MNIDSFKKTLEEEKVHTSFNNVRATKAMSNSKNQDYEIKQLTSELEKLDINPNFLKQKKIFKNEIQS